MEHYAFCPNTFSAARSPRLSIKLIVICILAPFFLQLAPSEGETESIRCCLTPVKKGWGWASWCKSRTQVSQTSARQQCDVRRKKSFPLPFGFRGTSSCHCIFSLAGCARHRFTPLWAVQEPSKADVEQSWSTGARWDPSWGQTRVWGARTTLVLLHVCPCTSRPGCRGWTCRKTLSEQLSGLTSQRKPVCLEFVL